MEHSDMILDVII